MSVGSTIIDLIEKSTAKWAKQRKAEIRDANARLRRKDALSFRTRPMTVKDAAFRVMARAYAVASNNGRLPANPRQIMYAARPAILKATGKETFKDDYFTQRLLVDYIEEHNCPWDIVWDDRGHFAEPHAGSEIGLGTLAVRNYIRSLRDFEICSAAIAAANVSTKGPAGRYGAVLFLEKEGFAQILEAAKIEERFDIAVMSTKGMSVTAARMLVEELCGRRGLKLFVLHDFDIAGFSIKKTLTESGRRYQFAHKINFVDLGLRLDDIKQLGLESEPTATGKDEDTLSERLRINGATEEEIEFLIGGERVELNSMTSDVFVEFVEAGLRCHGVAKVVPAPERLAETYAAFKRGEMAQEALEAELERLNEESIETPADLEQRMRAYLAEHPEETWDAAVMAIVEEADDADDEEE